MKILARNLSTYPIERLIIVSLEQALYQALVVIDGDEYPVWQNDAALVQSRSLSNMRDYFSLLDVNEVILRHESPYDEMVGQPEKTFSNRMEVPLGNMLKEKPDYLN